MTAARQALEAAGYDVLVFHATGTGGRAMESLVDSGYISGVLDVTTTEWCDEVVGGVLAAGPDRHGAAARAGVPQVVSVGALDMVNFGAMETVPDALSRAGPSIATTPAVTLMRTTAEECRAIAGRIAGQLNRATAPVTLVLPLRGVSMLDAAGAALPRPGGRPRALRHAARERRAARARRRDRRAHQRSGVRGRARAANCSRPSVRPLTRGERLAAHALHPTTDCSPPPARPDRRRQPIIGAGAGTGISAKFAERGGVDLIIIYNSGRFRMAGRGSLAGLLPYGDANAIVVRTWRGKCCRSSRTRRSSPASAAPIRSGMMPVFLRELQAMGFDGIQNFPTVGLIDGSLPPEPRGDRHGLRARSGDDRAKRARLDLLTCPYVFDAYTAKAMAKAGADVAGGPLGTDDQGIDRRPDGADARGIGAAGTGDARRRASGAERTSSCCATAAPSPSPRTPSTCWRARRGVAGFFGASSIERLATESGIEAQARRFREMAMPRRAAPRSGGANR